jgi:radical SAM family uncharacterized protein
MDMTDLNELLLTVRKPGRYVGGEWNSVKKEWTEERLKILLAFPDVYEVGMSYLGTKILYGVLNGLDDCLCERVFSPWHDLEKVLRENKIKLFSLESRKPIGQFDIIGFSLTYELGYTNVLNILDMGDIPKRSSERNRGDPLIIAGGTACYNPEPMADFIDAFLIGDGEEAILEIVDVYRKMGRGTPAHEAKGPASRGELLRSLAKIKGVYVPSLYKVEYNTDNTIRNFSPTEEGIPKTVEKRYVKSLDSAFYPVDQIVPNIQVVHDRLVLEIMRGCKHACRFCQATTTCRPCRERTKESILQLAKAAYEATGYDEISLLSLSSGDHSQIKDILRELNEEFGKKAVSISIPSLRVEDVLKELPGLLSEVKKAGLTFAPEAGNPCLRKIINKNNEIEKLLEAVTESFRLGWRRVKLYFMIGLPGEKEQDILDIAELVNKISNLRREIDGRAADVRASINSFIPKPHTPFQWEIIGDFEALEKKKNLLKSAVRSRFIELDFHSFEMGYLEAIISRGDRRLSEVIYESWKAGSRFDGWSEFFNLKIWLAAFERKGIDPRFYVFEKRKLDAVLPWDFVETGISKQFFIKEAGILQQGQI